MIKASEVREQQHKAQKRRLEERYSKQIKEVEDLIFQAIKEDKTKIKELLENAVELKVTGIVRPKEDTETALITNTVGLSLIHI